jgi:predicted HTH transcriptional regulator
MNLNKALDDAGESTPFIEFMLELSLKLKNILSENVPKNVSKNRMDEIVRLIEKNKEITSIQIAERLKVSDKTIKRDMATLKEQG